MAPEEWDPNTDIVVPDAGDYRARGARATTILTHTKGRKAG